MDGKIRVRRDDRPDFLLPFEFFFDGEPGGGFAKKEDTAGGPGEPVFGLAAQPVLPAIEPVAYEVERFFIRIDGRPDDVLEKGPEGCYKHKKIIFVPLHVHDDNEMDVVGGKVIRPLGQIQNAAEGFIGEAF